ncbi:hypothetical protein [Planktotalea sp.]|uniref:hypothetical protein n=1 Tax=Planktotalea sp. TaxID=2029877 RepID=UPI003299E3DF
MRILQPLLCLALFTSVAAVNAQEHCAKGNYDIVTHVNGIVPPGRMAPLVDSVKMIDTIMPDGNRLVVMKGTRLAGTRVGIHIHAYGGHTCVMSGVITDFVEGHDPGLFPKDTCYYMPPNTYMTAANLGSEDAVLIDTFIVPPGKDFIQIVETCDVDN